MTASGKPCQSCPSANPDSKNMPGRITWCPRSLGVLDQVSINAGRNHSSQPPPNAHKLQTTAFYPARQEQPSSPTNFIKGKPYLLFSHNTFFARIVAGSDAAHPAAVSNRTTLGGCWAGVMCAEELKTPEATPSRKDRRRA